MHPSTKNVGENTSSEAQKKRDVSEGAKDWEIGRADRSSPQVSAIEVTGPALLFLLAVGNRQSTRGHIPKVWYS